MIPGVDRRVCPDRRARTTVSPAASERQEEMERGGRDAASFGGANRRLRLVPVGQGGDPRGEAAAPVQLSGYPYLNGVSSRSSRRSCPARSERLPGNAF